MTHADSNQSALQKPTGPFDSERLLASLPTLPGVYRMLDANAAVLYVGKARDLKKRVSSYFQRSGLGPRIAMMVSQIASVEITVARSEMEALILEHNLIKSLAPRYNIIFRDDKSYPYLMISGARFPKLGFHRGNLENEHKYYGPFPHTGAVRESIQLLQRVFRLRTCEDSVFQNRSRPCLLYQIRRCSGPCVGKVGEQAYGEDVAHAQLFLEGRSDDVLRVLEGKMNQASDAFLFEEAAVYRDQIQALGRMSQKQYADTGSERDMDVLAVASSAGECCVNLVMIRAGRQLGSRCLFPRNTQGHDADEVIFAFLQQHYLDYPPPGAIVIDAIQHLNDAIEDIEAHYDRKISVITRPTGEVRVWLQMAQENARHALNVRLSETSSQEGRVASLREVMEISDPLNRIECFDVSHTQGEAMTASCVVFDQLEMRRNEYRHFNIANVTPGDDYAAMKEVLTRRYSKLAEGGGITPDLVLIDGGKGQLRVALEALEELGLGSIAVASVAKGPERKPGLEEIWIPGRVEPVLMGQDHPGLHLIQTIRDEAHRFAITGHRSRRSKSRVASVLETVPGVGAMRRRSLLARFGGIRGVMGASAEDIASVEGIGRKLAEKIYRELHAT